jgi:hypothetical protein
VFSFFVFAVELARNNLLSVNAASLFGVSHFLVVFYIFVVML